MASDCKNRSTQFIFKIKPCQCIKFHLNSLKVTNYRLNKEYIMNGRQTDGLPRLDQFRKRFQVSVSLITVESMLNSSGCFIGPHELSIPLEQDLPASSFWFLLLSNCCYTHHRSTGIAFILWKHLQEQIGKEKLWIDWSTSVCSFL